MDRNSWEICDAQLRDRMTEIETDDTLSHEEIRQMLTQEGGA